ncbi:hypothetical protein [Haloarcula onubensis]|uniref:Lipoprotein n=1 Tax=Haloarcula onubensis TaxID=2950539 RepID=A0ABU2FRI7_9EURY|nr:hypothetical protein [Halomicroarcula sp. S3CR25-11]MDS0283378.1 hypothetical protein [Halomicroarcula sp. S3CR25-11]
MVRYRAVAVVTLLVLSGCQGLDGGGETVTPAPVPTEGDVVRTDATALADRHRRALHDRSYATAVALTVVYANGTTARLTDEFAVGRDGAYRYDRHVTGPYPAALSNFTVWQNRSTEFRRTTADNGTATVRVSERPGFDDITLSGFLRRALSGFDLAVERANGRTRLTGRQTGPLTVPLPTGLRRGRNATLDAEIRGDVVRSVTVRARAAYADTDRPVTVRMRYTVRRVGDTDPTRPAWAVANGTA